MRNLKHLANKLFTRRSRKQKLIITPVLLLVIVGVSLFVYVRFAYGATRTWDGEGTDITCPGNEFGWSCAENWSSDTIPTGSDIALFDGTSDKIATVDASFAGSVDGVSITSGYDGTITQARSLSVNADDFVQDGGTWDGGSQTLDINDGDFTVSGGTHTATTGTWTVERNFTHSSGTLDMTGATVTFNNSNFSDDSTLSCLSLGGTVDVNKDNGGDFTLNTGCTATFGSFVMTRSAAAAGDAVINGSATGTNITIWNSLTIGGSGSLSLSGTITAADGGTGESAQNTVINCTGTLSPTVNVVKDGGGDFTLGSGCTATFDTFSMTHSAAGAGDAYIDGSATGNNITIWNNLIIGAGGSLSLSGTITAADGGTGELAQNTTLGCTGTITPTVNVVKDGGGDFTLGSGCTAAFDTFTVTNSSAGAGNVVLNGFATGTNMTINNDLTIGASATVNFSGTILATSGGTGDSAHDTTLDCNGNTINADFTLNKAEVLATFDLGGNCIINGDFTRTNGIFNNPGAAYTLTVMGDFSMSTTDTFGGSNLTLEMGNAGGTQTITQNAGTMSGIFETNNATGSAQLVTSFATGSTCNVVEGSFDLEGQTFNCGSTFTVEDGGVLELFGDESTTLPTLDSGSTVRYTGDSGVDVDNYILKDLDYYHLSIASVDSQDTYTPPSSSEDVLGNFTLSGGDFTAPSGNFTIGGDFAYSGDAFDANNGTVIFNDAAQNTTISGSNTFYDLSSTTPNKAIEFMAGSTQTIENSLTFTGSTDNLITLTSTSQDTQWNITSNGTESVSYVSVRDSNACGGNTINAEFSTNVNNNDCWTFTTLAPKRVQGGTRIQGGTTLQSE